MPPSLREAEGITNLLLAQTSCSMVLNLLQEVLSYLTWLWSALHLNCQCDNANVFSYYCISALGKSKQF